MGSTELTLPGDVHFDSRTQEYVTIVAGAQRLSDVTVQFPDGTIVAVSRKYLARAGRLERNEPIRYPEPAATTAA